MLKNTTKLLLLTTIVGSLTACQTTDKDSVFITNTGSKTSKTSVKYKLTDYKADESAKISINGKTYMLSKSGHSELDNSADSKRTENVQLTVRGSSNAGDADVTLFELGLSSENNFTLGAFVVGNKTAKMPIKNKATYNGSLYGLTANKQGDSNLQSFNTSLTAEVDFGTNDLDVTVGKVGEGSFAVSKEHINSNTFGFTLVSDGTLNQERGYNESISGDVSGSFYGDNADVMAGVGQMENKDVVGGVAIIAFKDK